MNNYKDLNDYEIMYMISENDEDATNLLFTKYKPVVEKLARVYYSKGKNYGLELEDFIQEGYYALFCAIKKFNMDKNVLFYTYAVICIKSKMNNLINRSSTDKHSALNNSISLFENVYDSSFSLLDIIGDKKALIPESEMENAWIENSIKEILYNMYFEYSIIVELKINGFNNREISKLLNKSVGTIYNAVREFKKNLSILIEKTSL